MGASRLGESGKFNRTNFASFNMGCLVSPVVCILAPKVEEYMNFIEKEYLPGIFTMDCWKIGPFINSICSVIGGAVGATITSTVVTVGTGGLLGPGATETFTRYMAKELGSEALNIAASVLPHGLSRLGTHLMAKGAVPSDPHKDNREYLFRETDKLYLPQKLRMQSLFSYNPVGLIGMANRTISDFQEVWNSSGSVDQMGEIFDRISTSRNGQTSLV